MDQNIRQRFSEIQKSINWPVYLFDYKGKCIDSNNLEKIGEQVEVPDVKPGEVLRTGKFQWVSVGSGLGLETYYIAMLGTDETSESAIQLIRIVFMEADVASDKTRILRQLLFNMEDVPYTEDELSEMGFNKGSPIQAVLMEHKGDSKEISVIIENIFEDAFVVEIDKSHLVMVKQSENGIFQDVDMLLSELSTELFVPALAGIGKRVQSWTQAGESFKTAGSTLSLGKKVGQEEKLFEYKQMMTYHLMSEIEPSLRKQYFGDFGMPFEQIVEDEELIQTAMRFFENDLNITETSRQLYVHRNTLIYRLNKIEKQTGLDLRSFDDAIQFYMLMLIWRLG
jgi:carbohydrate diacid regulator